MINVIIGRLGKDAEVTTTSGGTRCVRFTVAENIYKSGENKTTWYDVTSYDNFVADHQIKALKAGTFVVIVGDEESKVSVSNNGKVYLNHNVTATTIKIPTISRNNGDGKSVDTNFDTSTTPTMNISALDEKTELETPVVTEKPTETKSKTRKKTTVSEPTVPVTSQDDSNDDDELPF